jgi:hypothetical protein
MNPTIILHYITYTFRKSSLIKLEISDLKVDKIALNH